MISQELFTDKFKKLITLCSFPQNMANQANVEIYFEALKYTDERILLSAFKKICASPPNKLTLAVILYNVNELKPKKANSDWTEKECKVEGCERGLRWEKIEGNSYIFRCSVCDSSLLKHANYHTPENIWNEKNKHKPIKRAKEPNRIDNLTNNIG